MKILIISLIIFMTILALSLIIILKVLNAIKIRLDKINESLTYPAGILTPENFRAFQKKVIDQKLP